MGFVEEGVRKQSSYLNGQFVDEIYMAKLLNWYLPCLGKERVAHINYFD